MGLQKTLGHNQPRNKNVVDSFRTVKTTQGDSTNKGSSPIPQETKVGGSIPMLMLPGEVKGRTVA